MISVVNPHILTPAYIANAVNFDGTNDYMRRATDWTGGALTGKVGTLSLWVNFKGGDGAAQKLWHQDGGYGYMERTSANKFRIFMYETTGGTISLDMISTSSYTVASGWVHVAMAWDVAAGTTQMYINGASDRAGSPTALNNTLEYARETMSFGADQAGGGGKLNADIADFYFNTDAFIDLSVAANLQKFRSAAGKPVFLGLDGSAPTGAKPQICLTNPFGTWHQNLSGYGDYTVTGALTAGSSSPSA
ncbi:LamG-like jellyroll fold domain-containing protein [Ferrovibrio terrae]|uniref:LamG-like jellyroll fold domain-containing protein n=1 Tax=Ferrovibrio terrae TaxID=2594003 RepID=UPI00313794D6